MSIEVNISHNFDALEGYLDDIQTNAAIQAARYSINRTLLTLREHSVKRIRDRMNLKVGVIKKKHLFLSKAKGGNLLTLEGQIKYNTKPVPLLEFVQGKKTPRDQKGIKISKRKVLKARIRPGKTIKLRHAFIADVNTKQVFKRTADTSSRKVKKQGVTSVGFIFNKPLIRNELVRLGGKRFSELFTREYARRVENARKRAQSKPYRKTFR